MFKRLDNFLAPALLAGALFALGCQDSATPGRLVAPAPSFWVISPACFRMTGGGRIDKPGANMGGAELPTGKNTPDSHDFATFGFQARPTACNQTSGSGHITWVEHNTDPAVGGGFVLHGDVTFFGQTESEYTTDRDRICGTFSGPASVKRRDNGTTMNMFFRVAHACDEGEPGVGGTPTVSRDHIRMDICDTPCGDEGSQTLYDRAGFLTGGNLQKHRLTGSGA